MVNTVVVGCQGKMGQALVQAIVNAPDLSLTGATVSPQSLAQGQDIGQLAKIAPIDLAASNHLTDCLAAADVIIDFTTPSATMAHIALCQAQQKKMVIGTTGFSDRQLAQIQQASHDIAMVLAPNMSIGINLCLNLIAQVAAKLPKDWEGAISEVHHRAKSDSPSGTALKMGAVFAQHRVSPNASSLQYSSLRLGEAIGQHTLSLVGPGEQIDIKHQSTSRDNYALGALQAALWLQAKGPGLYTMQQVLNLS